MNKRVVVDPVTRIEGHLRIEADTDEAGAIKAASSSGTMVRGIEIILRGRDPREAWAFAQRICGVCTLVHASDAASGFEVQPVFWPIWPSPESQRGAPRLADVLPMRCKDAVDKLLRGRTEAEGKRTGTRKLSGN